MACQRCGSRVQPLTGSDQSQPEVLKSGMSEGSVTAPERPSVPVASAPTHQPEGDGGPRWVGDATLGGRSVSRTVDAGCYVLTGIMLIVIAVSISKPVVSLLGVGAILYGGWIYATRGSYWRSTAVYALAIIALIGGFSVLTK